MTEQAPREPMNGPVNLPPLSTRLRSLAVGLAIAALLAVIVDGMVRGLDFARMALWVTIFVACLAVGAAITAAVHAFRRSSPTRRHRD